MATSVREFLERNASVALDQPASSVNVSRNTRLSLSFPQRLSSVRHPLARRLMEAMFRKRSLLCLSADTRSANELLQVAREAAPHIILLKTHSDAVQGFSRSTGMELKRLAKEHDFLLMEDRKYSDIGSTVQSQYKASPICVNTWADLVTVHALPGPGVLEALRQVPCTGDRGVVLIAEMSSEGTLADKEYAERVVSMSEQFRDFVCGFVAQSPVHRDPGMLQMTPGVKLATSDEATSGDGLGQKYHSVRDAVVNRGADIIIVGRGILKSDDRSDAAESYQRASFDAYMERISRQSFSICV
ncbi:unnamed protein product [Cyprideis torosa]|uniref:Orotidine 5'-phosphate decarboxylase n=1 Tax=Cyprideis torosa TaxID=163714 RepID=A0A7R8ZJP4_9CRUS|nr:unnamed protein product [Cyprideis torosa]CAG0887569.1 unnamed protein product [Cyprideis torosa]